MYKLFLSVVLSLMVLFSFNSLSAQESAGTISIKGDIKNPSQWSVEQLKAQFADEIKEVKFMDALSQWKEKTGLGIPLYSVIKAAEPMIEKETKWTNRDRKDSKLHSYMTFFVILESGDSFRAFFSLAEMMPEFNPSNVYLIWSKDGEPLTGKDAPLRLVNADDKYPDRGIYAIKNIILVDGNKLAKQLKAE